MAGESNVLQGIVLGRTIRLDQEPGLPNGQQVQLTIQPVHAAETNWAQDGLVRAFGAWADEATSVDEFLEWNRQQRKLGRVETGA